MQHNFNDLWRIKEGTRTIYKLQGTHGIISFKRLKDAKKWQQVINNIGAENIKRIAQKNNKWYIEENGG